ncbi:MAG: glycoside hydrolase family 2 TIM barrel-domain containing protein [Spirosomataceae bacterium]
MLLNHPDSLGVLEGYVKDVMTTFKNDERILLWDLYNEPGNSGYFNKSLPLLKNVFSWAKAVNPSQPISAGVWSWGEKFVDLNKFQLENSDVITYHHYGYIDKHKELIDQYRKYNRPLICTEYMARKNGSLFQTIMPMLKQENVGAINWGFVAGKTNTIFAWSSPMPDGKEPELWFHDIFRKDGTSFSEDEVKTIKILTGKK